jgi:predicted amidohydrolase
MSDLRIALVQTELYWEDIDANLEMFSRKLEDLPADTDLVVLPEMFTTGFTMNAAAVAQKMSDSAVDWLKLQAQRLSAAITGSLVIEDRGGVYNRLVWAAADGKIFTYDKRHLFRYAGEHEVYQPGNSRLIVSLGQWQVCPFICYDLRFPKWTRNLNNQYDLAVFVANWPAPRALHWRRLLQARAIENQSYVIGVNRVGTDGKGLAYSGDSAVIDPLGHVLFERQGTPCVKCVTLSYTRLKTYREEFPAWMDADLD